MSKGYSYYEEICGTDNPDVKVFRRKDAKNWYARIKKPAGFKGKGKSPYSVRSLKTTDKREAIKRAADLYYEMRDKPSAFLRESSFSSFWAKFEAESEKKGKTGSLHFERKEGVWQRWMIPFINLHSMSQVEDWTLETFESFYDWRATYWLNKQKELKKKGRDIPKTVTVNPRVSTLRGEMNIAAFILRAFYSYAGLNSPDFHYLVKRLLPRELAGDNRARRTRGFAIPPKQLKAIRMGLREWSDPTGEDAPNRRDHRYARERLYWSLLFALHSRCRVGTELYNLKWGELRRVSLSEDGSVYTYEAWTTGKRGRRWLILDSDFAVTFERGWLSRREEWAEFGSMDDDAYVFFGNTNNKLDSHTPAEAYLQSTLFKKFILQPHMEEHAYHDTAYTGGKEARSRKPVRITPYDFRHTSISLAIINQGEKGMGELALLCGCSLAVMSRHYNNAQQFANMHRRSVWSETSEGSGGRLTKSQLLYASNASRRAIESSLQDSLDAEYIGISVDELHSADGGEMEIDESYASRKMEEDESPNPTSSVSDEPSVGLSNSSSVTHYDVMMKAMELVTSGDPKSIAMGEKIVAMLETR